MYTHIYNAIKNAVFIQKHLFVVKESFDQIKK